MALLATRLLPTKQYPFSDFRHAWSAFVTREGIVAKGDYAVTQRAAGADMSVDVAAGAAFVQGDDVVRQGVYEQVNDAAVNVPIGANASGNPRIDAIVLQIADSSVVGSSDVPALMAIAGTPTAAATLANLLGKPSIPNSCLLLGYVLVANGAATIVNANIGGLVDPSTPTLGAVAGAPPQYAMGRPADVVPAARARHSVSQATTTAVVFTSALDTVKFDSDAMYTAGRLTCKTPGLWLATASGQWAGSAGGARRSIWMNVNAGAPVVASEPGGPGAAAGVPTVSMTIPLRMGYGDFLQLLAFQDSGGNLNLVAVADYAPSLAALWEGP